MQQFSKLIVLGLLFLSVSFGQESSREQKIRNVHELRSRISELEKDILRPTAEDLTVAKDQGFGAIRILPREKYDHVLAIRGGGAYYSFSRSTHEYGNGSEIQLEQDFLSVGFAGADYGFLHDLGDVDLAGIEKNSASVQFLVNYEPPADEPAIRAEQRKSHSYEANGFLYKSRLPAVVGHTYVLRSINFAESDLLVAIRIIRKDTDGSLIIFWRPIETFKKPEIARNVETRIP
ncbi:MAG: hypothetical protein ABL984_07600 [Pyrinomonadaceae bacterium]